MANTRSNDMLQSKRLTSDIKTQSLKMEEWKIVFHVNGKQKKVIMQILISDKNRVKTKDCQRDKVELHIMIKGSVQEDIATVNTYVHNRQSAKYIRKNITEIKGEIDSNIK